jgi:mannose-6-phosphate isomerase-like protein (cupin superfamily)
LNGTKDRRPFSARPQTNNQSVIHRFAQGDMPSMLCRVQAMDVRNINEAQEWFEVLQTSEKSQTAVMALKPGGASGSTAEAHEKSEQVLLLLEGEVEGEVADEKRILRKGDVIVVPAGAKHRFRNHGRTTAVTFSVYSPPEYPPKSKG